MRSAWLGAHLRTYTKSHMFERSWTKCSNSIKHYRLNNNYIIGGTSHRHSCKSLSLSHIVDYHGLIIHNNSRFTLKLFGYWLCPLHYNCTHTNFWPPGPGFGETFKLNELKSAPSQLLPVFSEFDRLQTCCHSFGPANILYYFFKCQLPSSSL
jgi:hypothetical protein